MKQAEAIAEPKAAKAPTPARTMKIALISSTGNVGKTTLAANLFAPRMPGARIIATETLNETAAALGVAVDKMRGDQFQEMLDVLMLEDSAIVDVGASNIEPFLMRLNRFKAAHAEFDYFVIPVVPGSKEQQEALNMVRALNRTGITREKIRPVFNMVRFDVADECGVFIGSAIKMANDNSGQGCTINPGAVVEYSDLFEMLGEAKTSIPAILADETDHLAEARKEPDRAKALLLARKRSMRLLAAGVSDHLDRVFAELFGRA